MINKAALLRQVTQELQELVDCGEGLTIVLTPRDALIVLAQLQLALRHPKNVGPSAAIARAFARLLEVWLARTPGLADPTALGWHPAYGAPPTPWEDPGSSP